MGYTTEFEGKFAIMDALPKGMVEFVIKLSGTRRMKRKVPSLYGEEGEYYVLGKGAYGQDKEKNIINYNEYPKGQCGLWCHWTIEPDEIEPDTGELFLVWDGGEKFYNYIKWIDYLILRVFNPYGIGLYGSVYWQGEEDGDIGKISLYKNENNFQVMKVICNETIEYTYNQIEAFPKLDFEKLLKDNKDEQLQLSF